MNRKLWSNEEKIVMILEILRGDAPAAAICTRHGVSATQVYGGLTGFWKEGAKPSPISGPGEGATQCWMRTAN